MIEAIKNLPSVQKLQGTDTLRALEPSRAKRRGLVCVCESQTVLTRNEHGVITESSNRPLKRSEAIAEVLWLRNHGVRSALVLNGTRTVNSGGKKYEYQAYEVWRDRDYKKRLK
jgi:hypothetical protein